MLNDFWRKNYGLLYAKNREMAEAVERAETPEGAICKLAKSSDACLEYLGKEITSRHDPKAQAKAFVDSITFPRSGVICLFGLELGYIAAEITARLTEYQNLFIFAGGTNWMKLAMMHSDMSAVIKSPLVAFVTVDDPIELGQYFGIYIHNTFQQDIVFAVSPGLNRFFSRKYLDVANHINAAVRSQAVDLNTALTFGEQFQKNIINNFSIVHTQGSRVGTLFGKFADRPAICVAAGPSLDKNIEELRRVGDKAVIIAVATVLKKLLKAGIKPHIACCIDMSHLSGVFFEGLTESDVQDVYFVGDMEMHPNNYRLWPGKMFITSPVKPLCKWYQSKFGQIGELWKGGSVAHLCVDLAKRMGCKRIILAGQDCAFPNGRAHCEGANESWGKAGWRKDSGQGYYNVTSYDGGIVESDGCFVTFIQIFNQMGFEMRKQGFELINATEGGARLDLWKQKTLKDCIDEMVSATPVLPVLEAAHLSGGHKNDMQSLYAAVRELRGLLAVKAEGVAENAPLSLMITEMAERLESKPESYNVKELEVIDQMIGAVITSNDLIRPIVENTMVSAMVRAAHGRRAIAEGDPARAARDCRNALSLIADYRVSIKRLMAQLDEANL